MVPGILTTAINSELDVVASRQRARQIASLCGFNAQEQVRIATAVSELARNVYNYARKGAVHFAVEGETMPQTLVIRVEDQGPGIEHLELVLSGRYQSPTGMGLGILGARRLMDQFDIRTGKGEGTAITLKKRLPPGAPLLTAKRIGELGASLAGLPMDVTLSEVQQQNRELLATLAELKMRQDELVQLTRELEDTNRGVVALYAELDEKADHLRRADEMKSRFLSNMSHEFRTPLSSIRALAKLLLDRIDGDLTVEQERQVRYIQKGAESLNELVNDLLDLAKIEAGKTEVRPVKFDAAEMFSALRGMLRPLLVTDTVKLVFDESRQPLVMYTDEAKVSQILRNFISNALKFTEAGEVRVSASRIAGGAAIRFSVSDTGIGIAPEDQKVIFEEFTQVESRLQNRIKGTGLGLPLCRKLAELLGGRIELESVPGQGSTFSAMIPVRYDGAEDDAIVAGGADDGRIPVLIVEDQPQTMVLYEKFLAGTGFRPVPARSLRDAEQAWEADPPAAVVLDIYLQGEDTWHWLAKIKASDQRKHVPVVVVTDADDKRKGYALGADAYFVKPVFREEFLSILDALACGRSAAAAPTPAAGADTHQG